MVKRKIFIWEIIIIIITILICKKLELVGPIQQKVVLPSPKAKKTNFRHDFGPICPNLWLLFFCGFYLY